MSARRLLGRRAVAAAILVASVFGAAACGGEDAHDRGTRLAAKRLGVRLEPVLAVSPPRAARFALAADGLLPTPQTEMDMMAVAAHESGIDRVIAAHTGAITAIVRMKSMVATAGQDRTLRVWDAATGVRIAEQQVSSPIVRMDAASGLDGVILTAQEDGVVALWDVGQGAGLVERRLTSHHRGGDPPLAVGFTPGDGTALAVWFDGRVERWDMASGTRLRTASLARARGRLPWPQGSRLRLTAAAVRADRYVSRPELDVATADAVARVDLESLRGRTLVPTGQITGTITSVATTSNDPTVVIGTDSGFNLWRHETRALSPGGGGRSSVAFSDDHYVVASMDGVRMLATGDNDQGGTSEPFGLPAILATDGPGGAAIGRADGTVALLGAPGAGLRLPPGGVTPVARFGPAGVLLTVEGYDANHVDELATVRVRSGDPDPDAALSLPKVRTYKPDRRWWPQGESTSDNWYVSDARMDRDLVAAAGQDPTGTAVVLVWSTRTGRPLRRLALTTGGVKTSAPSIATGVQLLSKSHILAAYSAVQESLVLWSTSTWQRLATIAVGPAGGFAATPDEQQLIVAGLSDEQSGLNSGNRKSRLVFVDVARRAIDHSVATGDTARVAVAPDGDAIATVDAGRLRVLSPDGRHDLVKPVALDSELGTEVAWRPDGKLLAVGRSEGGVAIVDPERGRLAATLPTTQEIIPMSLDWSPSGRVLVVNNAISDDDGSGFRPVIPTFWRLDRATLRARMCQLAGRDLTVAEWRRDVGKGSDPQRPCATGMSRKATHAPPVRLPTAAVLAFVRRDQVLVAGSDGRPVPVAPLPPGSAGSDTSFVWSAKGAVGWAAGGRAWMLAGGKLRSWPCACASVVFDGSELATVTDDGTALLTFTPEATAGQRTAVDGLPREQVRLLARRGRDALVVGFPEGLESGSPAATLMTIRDRRVRTRSMLTGGVSGAPVAAPDGRRVAFRVSDSSVGCYPADKVAVADVVTGLVTYPALPDDVRDPHAIRSLSWPRDGVLTALVSRPPCSTERRLDWAPTGQLLRIDAGRFVRVAERDFDITVGQGHAARVTGPVSTETLSGRLVLTRDDGRTVRVADDVSAMSVRP
jgi:WD40 repeat protein